MRNAIVALHVVFAVAAMPRLGKRYYNTCGGRYLVTSGGRMHHSRCLAVAGGRSVSRSRLHRRHLAAVWPRRKICAVAVGAGRVRLVDVGLHLGQRDAPRLLFVDVGHTITV